MLNLGPKSCTLAGTTSTIPGHVNMRQFWLSKSKPKQSFPPCSGAGESQRLRRE